MARKKGVSKKESVISSSGDENSKFAKNKSDQELWEETPAKNLDEKKEELERLKKRIRELESEINKKDEEEIKEPVTEIKEHPKTKRKEVKTLVILIIILLIVDIASVYFYYNPDLSKFKDFFKFNNSNAVDNGSNNAKKCSDGTAYDSCSSKKPYYCVNGDLLKKAATCGCTSGYKVDFQDCRKV